MSSNIAPYSFMDSGKTTARRVLAQKDGRRFFDLDQHIEQRQGETTSQIFADESGQTFRRLEAGATWKPSSQKDLVIVTGGGAVLREESVDVLHQNDVVVLLDTSLDTLERRLDGVSDRPPLQRDGRQGFLHAPYTRGMPLYRTVTQLRVDVNHGLDAVSEQILQKAELFSGEST